jgi:hypothetical protein
MDMALRAAGIYRRMEQSQSRICEYYLSALQLFGSACYSDSISGKTSITQDKEGSSASSGLPHQRSQKAATE